MFKEIKKGIYSLDGYNPDNKQNVIVTVHPFYDVLRAFCSSNEHKRKLAEHVLRECVDYINTIEEIIKTYGGPIITLEEERNIHETAEYFADIGPKKDRYFIETKKDRPTPLDILWTDVVDFIRNFRCDSIRMMGGYILIKKGEIRGCLGSVAGGLAEKRFNVEMIKGATFSELPK